VDWDFQRELYWFIQLSLLLVAKLAGVLVYTPAFIFPAMFVFVCGWLIGRVYMRAQLSVKREQSVAKAPVLGAFSGAIAGLSKCFRLLLRLGAVSHRVFPASIRAYGAQEAFKKESMTRIDKHVRASRVYYNLNRCV
jgi:hypothetical protein